MGGAGGYVHGSRINGYHYGSSRNRLQDQVGGVKGRLEGTSRPKVQAADAREISDSRGKIHDGEGVSGGRPEAADRADIQRAIQRDRAGGVELIELRTHGEPTNADVDSARGAL